MMTGSLYGRLLFPGHAAGTATEHGEVRPVEREALLVVQALGERVDESGRGVEHAAADMADHVDVVVLGRSV
ncbi:MAG: hypothetical protein QOG98_3671, partial [Pseudonocardiales bacterium]|nr:hypothetical protein [Pseudonocardiales bacterium]